MWGLKSKTIAARSLALVLACSPLLFAGENKVPRPPAQTQPQRSQQPQTPQHHAGQWLRRYKDLPPDQQKRALDSDPQFRSLPEQRQQKLRDRLQRFNGLPPQQQQRILNRMETWEHLTPQQKSEARQVYSQIRQLPPDRRNAMQNAINALRTQTLTQLLAVGAGVPRDQPVLALAMLDYLGEGRCIRSEWIDALVRAQHDDGGWSDEADQPSNDHTTTLAVWVRL